MNSGLSNSVNFTGKITKFYVPGKNNTTLRLTMESKEKKLSELSTDIISLKCETLSKGKTINNSNFRNKKGFSTERLAEIAEKIQQKVKEGYDFLDELFKAQIRGGN